jgi:hypothetical protein
MGENFQILNDNEALFFQYRTDKNYGWNAYNPNFIDSPKLKYWVKKAPPIIFKLCLGMITAGQKKISFGLDLCF